MSKKNKLVGVAVFGFGWTLGYAKGFIKGCVEGYTKSACEVIDKYGAVLPEIKFNPIKGVEITMRNPKSKSKETEES